MDRDDLLYGAGIAATIVGTAEIMLRLKDRSESKTRFMHERRTIERSWEQYDPLSGWEPVPGFVSDGIRINKHGFRGPELVRGEKIRIMCVGDSTTFGPPVEKNTYPHIVQAKLVKRRLSRSAEVINAGVSGHSTYNMLFRINRLLRYKPHVVILYVGFNDMFDEAADHYEDNRRPYSSYWHYLEKKNLRCHLMAKIFEAAGYTDRKPIPLTYTPDEFVPFNFEYNLKRLLRTIMNASAQPVLMSLPKLIPDAPAKLSAEDIEKALLPDFIGEGDYDGFLKIYRSYDKILRQVSSETEVPLLDAGQAFEDAGDSRGSLFEDIRHLTPEGYKLLGEYVAKSLIYKGIVQ